MSRHLDAIDVVRVLTAAVVVAVHTLSLQPGGFGVSNSALLIVLHVSREVFVLLTAFVLCFSYRDRAPRRWGAFWRRRYLLVGVPYLVWTVIYFAADGPPWSPLRLAGMVLTGGARYHLYFLLVSMQLYLIFPLLRRLIAAVPHRWLLAAAVVYQLGAYAVATAWLGYPSPYLVSYLGFVVIGGVAAAHTDELLAWTAGHARLVFGLAGASAAAGLAWFAVQVAVRHRDPGAAATVFQPVVVVESLAVAWAFLAAGTIWAARGRPGRRWVRGASDASFGVYLAHPLLLQGLLTAGLGTLVTGWPQALVTVAALVVVVPVVQLACAGAVAAIRRTPLSLPLTGHPRRRPAPVQPLPATTLGGVQCEPAA
jgi:peptidoglycan/LPS O-acetylase OafA/YrhL